VLFGPWKVLLLVRLVELAWTGRFVSLVGLVTKARQELQAPPLAQRAVRASAAAWGVLAPLEVAQPSLQYNCGGRRPLGPRHSEAATNRPIRREV